MIELELQINFVFIVYLLKIRYWQRLNDFAKRIYSMIILNICINPYN